VSCFIASNIGDIVARDASDAGMAYSERPEEGMVLAEQRQSGGI
jgi:hypothetical protein